MQGQNYDSMIEATEKRRPSPSQGAGRAVSDGGVRRAQPRASSVFSPRVKHKGASRRGCGSARLRSKGHGNIRGPTRILPGVSLEGGTRRQRAKEGAPSSPRTRSICTTSDGRPPATSFVCARSTPSSRALELASVSCLSSRPKNKYERHQTEQRGARTPEITPVAWSRATSPSPYGADLPMASMHMLSSDGRSGSASAPAPILFFTSSNTMACRRRGLHKEPTRGPAPACPSLGAPSTPNLPQAKSRSARSRKRRTLGPLVHKVCICNPSKYCLVLLGACGG